MSSQHYRTLEGVFRDPVSATLVWADVEAMLVHFGASIREGRGSRISVRLNGQIGRFHRPHPRKEATRSSIRALRDLLTRAGMRSDA